MRHDHDTDYEVTMTFVVQTTGRKPTTQEIIAEVQDLIFQAPDYFEGVKVERLE